MPLQKLAIMSLSLALLVGLTGLSAQAKIIKASKKQCQAAKEEFYKDLAKDKATTPAKRDLSKKKSTSSKNGLDQELVNYCKKKFARIWNAKPSKKVCDLIAKYERQKQLTKMAQKNKFQWADFYYCRAKDKGNL